MHDTHIASSGDVHALDQTDGRRFMPVPVQLGDLISSSLRREAHRVGVNEAFGMLYGVMRKFNEAVAEFVQAKSPAEQSTRTRARHVIVDTEWGCLHPTKGWRSRGSRPRSTNKRRRQRWSELDL